MLPQSTIPLGKPVRTVVKVCDTAEGVENIYVNPQVTPFQPIQDTDAFATCD